jgi:hypothetical protein
MPVLLANQHVQIGPLPKGGVLEFTAPQTDNIFDAPDLNGITIYLSHLPKKVTLAMGNVYTLTARQVDIHYAVH